MKIYPKRLGGVDKLCYLCLNYQRLFNDPDAQFTIPTNDTVIDVSGKNNTHLDLIFQNLSKEMDTFGGIRRQ